MSSVSFCLVGSKMPFSLLVSPSETNSEQPCTTDITGSPSDSIYRSRSTFLPLPPPFSRSSSASSNETTSSHCESPTVVRSCKHCSFSFRSNDKQQDGLEFCSKGTKSSPPPNTSSYRHNRRLQKSSTSDLRKTPSTPS